MVVPNTIEVPSTSSGPGTDIYAATRVVSLIPGDGTDLTVAAAVAALPAAGGNIFIKQGVYPQAAPIALPDKPIRFVGAGSGWDGPGATTLDLGANLITLFTNANKKQYRFEHMNVIGNGAIGQAFFQNDQGSENYCDFEDVIVKDIQTCFAHTQPFWVRLMQFEYRPSFAFDAKFWTFLGGAGGNSFIWADQTKVIGATIDDNPFLYATNSEFSLVLFSGPVVNAIREVRAASCEFSGQSLITAGRFAGCQFSVGIFGVPPARYLDILTGPATLAGCNFNFPATAEEVRNAGERVSIYGCEGNTFIPKITETGAANNNRYEDIALSSTILGASTIVNQWNTQTVAVDTLLDEVHRTTLVDATAANRTITLPTAASAKYRKYIIKKIDATVNTVTIDAAGAETIDGSLTIVLSSQYKVVEIQSNGTAWSIVAGGSTGTDLYAATRIVSLVPGEGTDLTIAAAIAALPAAGGDIYVKGGTYPIAAPLDFGAKVVRLRGAGTSVNFTTGPVTLVPAAGISLFKNGGQGSSVEDITAEGDNASSQVFYEGSAEIRFSRINTHDIGGIIKFAGSQPEVTFRDSYINVPSGVTIPLADRYLWKGGAANGKLNFDNVELFITGGGATIMSGVTAGANGPEFRVVNSYVGGGGGGGSTNFWFAQVIDWVGFDLDNAQFQISGARNNVVNCNFLDSSFKFLAVWNFISNSNFSQGGTGAALFDAQLTFDVTGLGGTHQSNIVTGCNFYGNGAALKGIRLVGAVQETAISNCLFSNHSTEAIEIPSTVFNAQITGCTFARTLGGGTRYIDIGTAFRITVSGCTFDGSLATAVRCAGSRCVFTGNVLLTVDDTGNINFYQNNTDLNPAGVTGASSLIENYGVINTSLDILLNDVYRTVEVDASGGNRTVTLPSAASSKWRKYAIKKIDATANTVTVDANGAELIDGALTQVLLKQYQIIEIQSNGTGWDILVPQVSVQTRSNRTLAANTALAVTDQVVLGNAAGGAITLTLPNPALYSLLTITIKKIDATGNAVTISQFAAETIDGAATMVLNTQYQSVDLYCDGTNWHVV